MQSLKAKVISGVFWVGGTKAVGQLITWTITIVVVRLLAPEDYGLMGMALLFTGFLLLFNDIGLGAAIIQNADLTDEQVSDLRWVIFGINAFLCAVLVAGAPLVGAYFREPVVVSLVRVLAVSFLISAAGAPAMYMLSRQMAFRKKSQAEFAGSLAGGASTLILAWLDAGVWSLVLGYLIQQLTTNTLYCRYCPLPFRSRFSLRRVRTFVRFGIQIAASRFFWYVSSNADFMVVGRLLGTTQLGYYSLAFQFSSIPIDRIVNLINQVAFPSFSAVQHDDETLRRHFLKVIGTIAIVTFPMFLGLLLVADAAVALFLTAKWAPVVVPLKILCVVACVRAIHAANAPLAVAKGKPHIMMMNTFLQALIMPAAFFVGASYGLVGVSVAWLVTAPVLFAIMIRQTIRLVNLPLGTYLHSLKPAVFGSAVMWIVVHLVQTRLLVGAAVPYVFAVSCAVGIVTYLGYHLLFNPDLIREPLAMISARLPVRWRSHIPQLKHERVHFQG